MKITDSTQGLCYAFVAYGIWGFFPLFFNLLSAVEPPQVLAHRVIWSCALMALLLSFLNRWPAVISALKQRRLWLWLSASAVLISCNWLIFIWAVSEQQVLASSLGYFLTPIVSVILATLFLREKLTRLQWLAVALAAVGIGWQVLSLGVLPWIALTLALSFGLYGLVRKQAPVDPLTGLLIETLLLLPLALLYWLYLGTEEQSQFVSLGADITALLVVSGLVTAAPLLAFAAAAKRLTLTVVGFMMYLNPTLQFFTAVVLFEEPFDSAQLIAFAFIWAGLGVFSYTALRAHKQLKR